MKSLDWIFFALCIGGLTSVVFILRRYSSGVADFLAANRCAGRYLLAVADGASGVGAVTFIALFELHYSAGFVPEYWQLMLLPIGLIITLSGWVVYRFRQTRAFTLAEFLEMRYSRRFRIFAGTICFFSGIINFGIFPAVTARFFMHILGVPETVECMGLVFPCYPLLMFILLSTALFYTLSGGQVTIMVTNFLQGQFINIVLVLILAYLLLTFDWQEIAASTRTSPTHGSMLNPFASEQASDFDFWFYAIAVFGSFYGVMAWQGSQAYNASAKTPHEARMSKVLGNWRTAVINLVPVLIPVCAVVVMQHPSFSAMATEVLAHQSQISDEQVRQQMLTPTVMLALLPPGLLGLFAAMMWAAAVSTDNSYMHSWGSILVQDVIIPIYGKALSPKAHMLCLKLSITGVAIFAFVFSLLYKQNDYIIMFMSLTGAVFVGGAGSVIIGGLYWKRGSTAAAWVAMTLGATLPIAGLLIRIAHPDFFLNGQEIWFISMVSALSSYMLVSLCGHTEHNLDKLLHRGTYASSDEPEQASPTHWKSALKSMGVGPAFSRSDKLLYYFTAFLGIAIFGAFLWGLLVEISVGTDDAWWAKFWYIFIIVSAIKAFAMTVWFCIGGYRDIISLIRDLKQAGHHAEDDGFIEESKD